MQAWPVQDAKARFSEFLDACIAGAPQMVTKRGAEAAVLVPVDFAWGVALTASASAVGRWVWQRWQ